MSKKIALVALIILLMVFGSLAAIGWYAMAYTALDMIKDNVQYMRQQIVLNNYQLSFDYSQLRIGSHYLQPKITMTKPRFTISNSEGTYYVSLPELDFISSFSQSHKYRLLVDEEYKILVQNKSNPKRVIAVAVSEYPDIWVNSSLLQAEQGNRQQTNYWFDEYKIKFPAETTLTIYDDGERVGEKLFSTRNYNLPSWQKLHFSYYPYVNSLLRLVAKIENEANKNSPDSAQ